jgi:hypothetical protein
LRQNEPNFLSLIIILSDGVTHLRQHPNGGNEQPLTFALASNGSGAQIAIQPWNLRQM